MQNSWSTKKSTLNQGVSAEWRDEPEPTRALARWGILQAIAKPQKLKICHSERSEESSHIKHFYILRCAQDNRKEVLQ